jgi:hypothetical protein
MSKNRLAIIFVMMIFLLAIIPTALSATSSQTSQYEDGKWLNFYNSQSERIISDLNDMNAALNADDYDKLREASQSLIDDAQSFLKKSKGFKVSPGLKNVKEECELSESYHVKAGKYSLTAVNKQQAGDMAGRNKAFLSVASCLDSSTEHINKMQKYLKIYTGKSKTSTSNSNTGESKTRKSNSNSNSISNKPIRPNTGSGSIIANSNTKVYHNAGCRYVPTIHPEHLTYFNNRNEAESAGYRACKVCGG